VAQGLTTEGFDAMRHEGAAMPKAFFIALGAAACIALVSPALADTQAGIQAVVISGTHYQPKGNVSGTGLGGFITLDERWPAVQVHLEGFPSVATATVQTTTGPVHAALGLFAATARFRMDRLGRFWFGAGTEVLAQQTPQAGLSKIDTSRLAGSRFEFVGSFPAGTNRFVETQIAVMPHISGVVYETRTAPISLAYSVKAPETASMIDLSAAYGIRRGGVDYLFGVRAINFAAKFSDGREADRNVGAGLSAEIRFRI
jgi:hypothetical protein